MTEPSYIISASRRTDIPAFYSKWFMQRILAKSVLVKNPFNQTQVRRISLSSENVSAIVFWTRDFSPMLQYDDLLASSGYKYIVLWTITGYPKLMEPNGVLKDSAIESLVKTAKIIGPSRIAWRYDPIIITREFSASWHVENFRKITERLKGYVYRVIISFMTPYRSVVSRMQAHGIEFLKNPLESDDVPGMLNRISEIASEQGMETQSCCGSEIIAKFGIHNGACIDASWLSQIFGTDFVNMKDPGQRAECLCTKSIDIGAYGTCPRCCIYCYAVKNCRKAKDFRKKHNSAAEWLE